jgi:hypothetical protein
MFGKRSKRTESEAEDFEGGDLNNDFIADDGLTDGDNQSASEWSDEAGDGTEEFAQPRQRSSLAKVLPWAALGVIGAAGAGYFYLNHMAPSAQPAETPVVAEAPTTDATTEPTDLAAAPVDMLTADPNAVTATPDTPVASPETPAATEAMGETAPPLATSDPTTDLAASPLAEAPADGDVPAESAVALLPVAEQPADVAVTPADATVIPSAEATPADLTADTASAITGEVVAPAADPVQPAEDATAALEPVVAPAVDIVAPTSEPAAVTEPVTATEPTEPVVEATAAVTTPDPVVAPTTATAPANGEQIADMSERMSVIEHQIADLTKALDRVASQPATTTNPTPDADLSRQVAQLQTQVRDLQAELASVKANRPAASRSNSAASTSTPKPQTAAPAQPRVTWTLRAAQSGEAWISRSAQGELKSVKVGETVTGLGRVTDIRLRNGRWEVVGTQATVRQ